MVFKEQFQRIVGKSRAAEETSTENEAVANEIAVESEKIEKTEESDVNLGNITLLDCELIAMLELIDRRVASLEHDLWLIKSKIAALAEVPAVGTRENP